MNHQTPPLMQLQVYSIPQIPPTARQDQRKTLGIAGKGAENPAAYCFDSNPSVHRRNTTVNQINHEHQLIMHQVNTEIKANHSDEAERLKDTAIISCVETETRILADYFRAGITPRSQNKHHASKVL